MFSRSRFLSVVFLVFVSPVLLLAQPFTNINAGLTGVSFSEAAWGDYDADGDLDLAVSGTNDGIDGFSAIYKNENGNFLGINVLLPQVQLSSLAWGDFDNDNDLDLFVSGDSGFFEPVSKIFVNNGNDNFSEGINQVPDIMGGSALWFDSDNDGDLDLLYCGVDADLASRYTTLYTNTAGILVESTALFDGISSGEIATGDLDNDNDNDIILTGYNGASRVTRIYENQGNNLFQEANPGMSGTTEGSVTLGDYDNDGDLDALIAGKDASDIVFTKLYRNDGNFSFTEITAGLIGVSASTCHFGDSDNDGDLDILLAGVTGNTTYVTYHYLNNGDDTFTQTAGNFPAASNGCIRFADFDFDNDLDFVVTGAAGYFDQVTAIFRNDVTVENQAPSVPDGLITPVLNDSLVVLMWNDASDDITPVDGLTYNIRVGVTPGGSEIVNSQTRPEDGKLLLAAPGNTGLNNSWNLPGLALGTYYWSVQAVDGAFVTSEFAPEASFEVTSTSVEINPAEINEFALIGNYPNPFNATTRLHFSLDRINQISLSIYDIEGRLVNELINGEYQQGQHSVTWNGCNTSGVQVSSGTYIYMLKTKDRVLSSRMMLVK